MQAERLPPPIIWGRGGQQGRVLLLRVPCSAQLWGSVPWQVGFQQGKSLWSVLFLTSSAIFHWAWTLYEDDWIRKGQYQCQTSSTLGPSWPCSWTEGTWMYLMVSFPLSPTLMTYLAKLIQFKTFPYFRDVLITWSILNKDFESCFSSTSKESSKSHYKYKIGT